MYFSEKENVIYSRAVDYQECIRVSGKHNDLEESLATTMTTIHFLKCLVTGRSETIIRRRRSSGRWNLSTGRIGTPKYKLYATIFENDLTNPSSFGKGGTDFSHSRILGFGAKDNFWEMGEIFPF